MSHDAHGETVHKRAERGWAQFGDVHTVCAADQVGMPFFCRGAKHLRFGDHAFYRKLRVALMETVGVPFSSVNLR